ncbi:hypothetical protein LUX57_09560 [Actinomadura madurae]|nr:hypothetical protein [Actinomadura madurae]MCP9965350.1 hypothetical protein [Actinomadura madurae]
MSLAFFRRRSGRDDRAGRSPLRVATEVQSTVFRIARLTITAVLSFVLALAVLPARRAGAAAGAADRAARRPVLRLPDDPGEHPARRRGHLGGPGRGPGREHHRVLLVDARPGDPRRTDHRARPAAGRARAGGAHLRDADLRARRGERGGRGGPRAGDADRRRHRARGHAAGADGAGPAAEEAVQDVAEKLRELLAGIADGLRGERAAGEAARWQEEAERLAREIGRTDRDLGAAEESVRLNPRTRARRLIDAGVALRNAMETMEHFTLSLRGLTRSLADDERLGDRGRLLTDPELRRELGDALAGIAASISAYGRLARSDLARDARPFLAEHELETRVDVARERRARLTRRLHERAAAGDLWPLYGEVSMDIDRLIENLRVEHRARAREHWRRHRGAARHLPPRPVRAVQQAGHTLRKAAGSAAAAAERNARESGERYHRP